MDARKKNVLLAVVEAYIQTGEPVGSKMISQLPQIHVSAATVRNDMAVLEELGYLEQPHTSAGRVPTYSGYRFYIDEVVEQGSLSDAERKRLDAMLGDESQLTEDLLQARLILEPALAALAAQNGSEEEIKELEYILKELEGLIRDKKDYSEKDSQFHAQIATCSHNRVMTNLIPVITEGVRVFADSVEETEYEQTLLSHRRIFEAIRDGRGEDARQEMYFHLMYNHNRYRIES